MPRPPRVHDPETFAHLTMHAVGTDRLFNLEPEAVSFLRILGQVVSHHGLELFAYCLMSTHVHLLIRDPQARLPYAVRDLTGRYARWFNKRHRRRGPLFEGRYHRTPVDDDGHFLAAVRYIVRNPVEAVLCRSAADWRWSSHRAQAGVIGAPAFLRAATVLEMLSSAEAYVHFVEDDVISTPPAAAPPHPAHGSRAGGR
jgi:putative transposase